jgi:hypothetical protein
MTNAIEKYVEAVAFLSAAKQAQEHANGEVLRAPSLRTYALQLAAEQMLTAAYGEVGRARASMHREPRIAKSSSENA